jgi:hypothetical protein
MKRTLVTAMFGFVSGVMAFGQTCPAAGATAAKADEKKAGCQSTCSSASKDGKAGKCCMDGDALAKAGLKMPEMMYVVGDKKACCPNEAKELAKGDMKLVKYSVAEKTYDTEDAASEAYAKALDSFVSGVTTVKYAVGDQCVACPMSAADLAKKEGKTVQYRLASFSFESEDVAAAAAKAGKEAADKVEMKRMVGSECVACPKAAAALAAKDGKSIEYVIGEKRMGCEKAATVALAKARAEAALAAIAKAAEKKA